MAEKKSSRTLINLIGIPSLLLIIIVGDKYHQLPIFSLFIGVVLFIGIREIPIFLQNINAKPFVFIIYVFVSLLQINRHPLISWNLSEIHLLVALVLLTMIVEIFRKKEIFDGAQIELYNNVLWENKVDLNKDEYSEVVACSHNILQNEVNINEKI